MLIQFNFSNFRSFKNDTSLDLSATRISELPSHVIETGGDKVLTFSAIYGANASGKSNVYKAFEFMSKYVINSFSYGGDSDNDNDEKIKKQTAEPFLFNKESVNEPSSFEVFFTDSDDPHEKVYQYGFLLEKNDILEEWLYSKAKTAREYRTIFYRKRGEPLQADGLSEKDEDLISVALEKETLIVSLGSKLKIKKLKFVREWFLKNEILDYGNPRENYVVSHILPTDFDHDKNAQQDVVRFLSTFDESIKDFKVEAIPDSDKEGTYYSVRTVHKVEDDSSYTSIALEDESSGTLKMFSLYPFIKDVFNRGSVLFVDELNSRLHPLLVRNIILAFANKRINTKHAQLIFTSHDLSQFSNDILRRDELWVTEKNRQQESELYSIVDFKDPNGNKTRKDEALSKHYLYGEFGGIPSLSPFEVLTHKGERDG
ncbi:MAG: ATP-binding protein [Lachnospiraceae bacterium]|nr:ATP-binding protein [Lachnospiraceae bacterium]